MQLDLFGGRPTEVVDVPVPPPEPAPESLDAFPVLEGQLDLLNARAVKLRPVMDLLADARFDDAARACEGLGREEALCSELRWFAALLPGLATESLVNFDETHAAVLERLRSVGTAGIATSGLRGVHVRVARHLDSAGPGARLAGTLAAEFWLSAERVDEALQSLSRAKQAPVEACAARLLDARVRRGEHGTPVGPTVAEAFVIDPGLALAEAGRWPEVDPVVARVEEWELEPVAHWVALAGFAFGAWPCPPPLETLPHVRARHAVDELQAALDGARRARESGRIDVDARKALAGRAGPLFRALLAAGRV